VSLVWADPDSEGLSRAALPIRLRGGRTEKPSLVSMSL